MNQGMHGDKVSCIKNRKKQYCQHFVVYINGFMVHGIFMGQLVSDSLPDNHSFIPVGNIYSIMFL